MPPVYENVIVPFDGSLPSRAALAPAADLAWRCGAKIVIVNNTEVNDASGREAVKSRAMSMSGADVDFWVDLNHDLGDALVEASKFRSNPVICISVRGKSGGLRKRFALGPVGEQVLEGSEVPVLVIGPETDLSRGLPMVELIASLDGSTASERILPVAAEWAVQLKLKLKLVGVVSEAAGGDHQGEAAYLKDHARSLGSTVPGVSYELVKAKDPATGLVDLMGRHEDAVLAMSTHGKGGVKGPVGGTTLAVLARCPRAVLLARPS